MKCPYCKHKIYLPWLCRIPELLIVIIVVTIVVMLSATNPWDGEIITGPLAGLIGCLGGWTIRGLILNFVGN